MVWSVALFPATKTDSPMHSPQTGPVIRTTFCFRLFSLLTWYVFPHIMHFQAKVSTIKRRKKNCLYAAPLSFSLSLPAYYYWMRRPLLLLRREVNKQVTVTNKKKHLFGGRNNTGKRSQVDRRLWGNRCEAFWNEFSFFVIPNFRKWAKKPPLRNAAAIQFIFGSYRKGGTEYHLSAHVWPPDLGPQKGGWRKKVTLAEDGAPYWLYCWGREEEPIIVAVVGWFERPSSSCGGAGRFWKFPKEK